MSAASFPPIAIVGGVMIAAALGAATLGRLEGPLPSAPAPSTPVNARSLLFVDRPDGGIAVRDAASGATVEIVAPGTNGFLRALVRGVARERRLQQRGQDEAFELTAWSDGRLTLTDPLTGERVDLEAFGPTNAAAFARLLAPKVSP